MYYTSLDIKRVSEKDTMMWCCRLRSWESWKEKKKRWRCHKGRRMIFNWWNLSKQILLFISSFLLNFFIWLIRTIKKFFTFIFYFFISSKTITELDFYQNLDVRLFVMRIKTKLKYITDVFNIIYSLTYVNWIIWKQSSPFLCANWFNPFR